MTRPSATYRGARRAEAKQARKKSRGQFRTVGDAMVSFADILKINAMRKARAQHA